MMVDLYAFLTPDGTIVRIRGDIYALLAYNLALRGHGSPPKLDNIPVILSRKVFINNYIRQ